MKRTVFSPHNDLYIQYLKSTQKHNMTVQHYHDAYEIYLQLGGKRYLFYDNVCYTLERGDIAIFKPFDIHYAESREAERYDRYVLNFRSDDLSILLSDEEKYYLLDKLKPCVMHLTEKQTQELFDYFSGTNKHLSETGFLSRKVLYSSVIQLLVYVIKCTGDAGVTEGKHVPLQIASAIEYINMHYKESITLEQICDSVNISKYHFCHTFKHVTGATVMEYVNNVRLTKVHSLLIHTNHSMEELAKETGFSSSVNLNRVFKKVYGISPRAFRKEKDNR